MCDYREDKNGNERETSVKMQSARDQDREGETRKGDDCEVRKGRPW